MSKQICPPPQSKQGISDYALWDIYSAVERALVITRVVTRDVYRISGYGKDNPTQEDALICNWACKNDLMDTRVMLEAVESMLETAHSQVSTLAMGGDAV